MRGGKCKSSVLFFVARFPVISETFIANQIADLKKRGYKVTIIADTVVKEGIVHSVVHKSNLLDDVTCIEVPSTLLKRTAKLMKLLVREPSLLMNRLKLLNFFKYGRQALNLRLIYRAIALEKVDGSGVIISHFGDQGLLASKLIDSGYLTRHKLITCIHGMDAQLSKRVNAVSYRFLYQYSNIIAANTNYTVTKLLELECPKSLIQILHAPLDCSFFKSNPIMRAGQHIKGKVRILFVGRLIPFKGPDKVLTIVRTLLDKYDVNIHVDIIGSGEMEASLKRNVALLSLDQHVQLHGSLSQDVIIEKLSTTDIFLYPGRTDGTGRQENQGLVIQEAQSMEVPVVCSKIGGMPEGIVNGESGFLLEENDIQGFVEKLHLLIVNPDLRMKMGVVGRRFTLDHFDTIKVGDRLEEMINSVVQEG